MADNNAYGAIRYQDGFGINPLKLAWGYQRLARESGVTIHCDSPVQQWHQQATSHSGQVSQVQSGTAQAPQGKVTAKKVVIATNGYTTKHLHPIVKSRSLPVLSQIIVTQPLSDEQIAACNFLTSNVIMDTQSA